MKTFYHGTSLENKNSILSSGLVKSMLSYGIHGEIPPCVFLCGSKGEAYLWAEHSNLKNNDEGMLVLKVTIPESWKVYDDPAQKDGWFGTYFVRHNIPPRMIEVQP